MDGYIPSLLLSSSFAVLEQAIQNGYDFLPELTWPNFIAAISILCIVTRIYTGLRYWYRGNSGPAEGPWRVVMVPYWLPRIGHGLSLYWDHLSCITKARYFTKEPVFGLKLGAVKQNVVVSPSLAKSILSFPGASRAAVTNYISQKVFGGRGEIRKLKPTDFQALSAAAIMKKSDGAEALKAELRFFERETPNLVSFSKSLIDQAIWEHNSRVTVNDDTTGEAKTCEASLFTLLRGFMGYISANIFMGRAFADSFTSVVEDFWTFDDQFTTFATGAPYWLPTPGISAGYPVRERLLRAFRAFHDAFTVWDDGGDPGMELRDLDDVPENMKERIRISRKLGLSPRASASGHLHLFSTLLRNMPNIEFWLLLHLYSNATLLEEIRKEIAPYAKASRPNMGLSIQEPPKLSIDVEGLVNSCPLLKATYYETLRYDTADFSFRKLTSDLDLAESVEDAAHDGLKKPRNYKLQSGEYIAISHGAYQKDARYFKNPNQFDPQRFISTNSDTKKKEVDTRVMPEFDDNLFENKGHAFAEREILALTTTILLLWDIEPAGKRKEWKIPGHKSSIGAFAPRRDVRVKMRMRI